MCGEFGPFNLSFFIFLELSRAWSEKLGKAIQKKTISYSAQNKSLEVLFKKKSCWKDTHKTGQPLPDNGQQIIAIR